MKTIILCGGKGTRMKEETEFRPKPLVKVGGKPIVWHIMKLYSYYGFHDFIIALGYKGGMIEDYFRKFNDDGFNITFVDTGEESLTGERILRVKEHVPDPQFMVTYGDGLANINIGELASFHNRQGTIGTITGVNPTSRYGLMNIDEGRNLVTGFSQKPVTHDNINGGFMVFNYNAFQHFDSGAIENIFDTLIPKQELSVYKHEGFWKCMDTYQEVEEMNNLWETGKPWAVWEQK